MLKVVSWSLGGFRLNARKNLSLNEEALLLRSFKGDSRHGMGDLVCGIALDGRKKRGISRQKLLRYVHVGCTCRYIYIYASLALTGGAKRGIRADRNVDKSSYVVGWLGRLPAEKIAYTVMRTPTCVDKDVQLRSSAGR